MSYSTNNQSTNPSTSLPQTNSDNLQHNDQASLEDQTVTGDIADNTLTPPEWEKWDEKTAMVDDEATTSHAEETEQEADEEQPSRRRKFSQALKWPRKSEQEAEEPPPPSELPQYTDEARNLVRTFTYGHQNPTEQNWTSTDDETVHGSDTPTVDQYIPDIDYVPAPKQYKPSIFGAILSSRLDALQKQYESPQEHLDKARKHIRASSDPSSGSQTPKKTKWYEKPEHSAIANMLVQSGIASSTTGLPETPGAIPKIRSSKPPNSNLISTAVDMINKKNGHQSRNRDPEKYAPDVVAEVADILARRKYLIKLCDAFMRYGAPTHRLQEYCTSSARALAIDAEFMYIPGAMMCTFIDSTLQTNTVELVRTREGLDFARLKDVFNVYKCVIHDKFTAEEGIWELENIQRRPDVHTIWFRILNFGLASVFVGPFSFQSRPIDFIPQFFLGCALGFMQLKIVPRSDHFSNVFEVFACVMAAFVARGLGSIKLGDGQYLFCFSATAQSSIAMILPGFLVLNSALELQGRSMVSGSVRMIYSIIYVLFLGFGLLIGTTIFGLIKRDATTETTCHVPEWFAPTQWQLLYTRFIWAPLFACSLAIVYRARWSQLPVMALIAVCGHQANYWMSTVLSSNLQVANAVGAFVIGCLANLYSRFFHGLAAAAMLPAIYCQVPGGLAASGSLVAGVRSSEQIFGNSSTISVVNNGTQGFASAEADPSSVYGGTIFNVGYGMIQVSIGISVGLYLSALVVYPYGKRRSGLQSF